MVTWYVQFWPGTGRDGEPGEGLGVEADVIGAGDGHAREVEEQPVRPVLDEDEKRALRLLRTLGVCTTVRPPTSAAVVLVPEKARCACSSHC
ncbi:hypothetical protein GA0115260_106853 [Streptomyces sp. MnatMP-M27]|nr:hypothetical protein DNK48_16140 [Streptomyces malaysiensis]SCG03788.1 hypothetical protein GA0115260_106853 [Streptomyces sp. MnatMP-M27]